MISVGAIWVIFDFHLVDYNNIIHILWFKKKNYHSYSDYNWLALYFHINIRNFNYWLAISDSSLSLLQSDAQCNSTRRRRCTNCVALWRYVFLTLQLGCTNSYTIVYSLYITLQSVLWRNYKFIIFIYILCNWHCEWIIMCILYILCFATVLYSF